MVVTSLYRKWRSQSFEDLVGQEHVVRTLRNAVRQHRVAHAYLFTGPRGTGKTSTARILAKAVNCLNPVDGNPCTTCENCRAAQEGRALDVIEIDAASNTSVENVRDLRERVGYAAGEGRYKVYIVDEVHRLSGAAFDAFLKTLEEPPPHVIFVFASTEPQKVPATITSRCQRFDFRRFRPEETLTRLRHVAAEEHLPVSDSALSLIAHSARGSLRDALGLLEQVSSYSEGNIDVEHVRHSLGLADPRLVAELTDHLLSGNTGSGLSAAEDFFSAGGESQQLLAQLIAYWRALLLTVTSGGRLNGSVDPDLETELQRHAGQLDEGRIVAVLQRLVDQSFSAKYDIAPSLPFEVAYVEAALALSSPAPVRAVQQSAQSAVSSPVRTPPTASPIGLPVAPVSPAPDSRPVAVPNELNGQVEPAPVPAAPGNMDETWAMVMNRMGTRNKSVQAILRSGYLMKALDGEVTVGFFHDFHANYWSDVQKRRVLEEVISEVLGSPHRVQCVKTTREEVESIRGAGAVPEDDGFVDEAAERLRRYHAREMGNGHS